ARTCRNIPPAPCAASDWSWQRSREGADPALDLVAHATVARHRLVLASGAARQARRVVEADVHTPRLPGEDGAGLVRVVADGDDVIERHVLQLIHVLGALLRDVHARFGHCADGETIHPVRLHTGAEGVDHIAPQRPGEPLGHLAATGIAR